MSIPLTETERLIVREFTHADAEARRLLVEEAFKSPITPEENAKWLHWTIANYRELEKLYQPPYGDYAIVHKASNTLIGTVGLVQSVVPWGVLPNYRMPNENANTFTSPEFGLYWAVLRTYQGKGYASEAAKPIIYFVFNAIRARRIVATTEHTNIASQRVMTKLGMTIEHNPGTEPFWFEVVGVLNNPQLQRD